MATSLFSLKDQLAVVIGATGVLGGALAEGLAAAGATVAVLGRNAERGQACVQRINSQQGKAKFFSADATDPKSLAKAHLDVESAFGAPTVLLNAAGGNDAKVTITADRPFEALLPEDWRASLDLNLMGGVVLPCQEFGPAMARRGHGSIINIASVASHIPVSRVIAYAAGKAAVLNLTQFLAREWATKGVRVNSITPGFFPAEQNRALLMNPDGSPTPRAQSILGHTPMARFGRSEELVGAAVFLASPLASSFVTGTDIRVDGGFLSQTI